jgi:hypothetical protein
MFTTLTLSSLVLASVPAILAQSVGTGSCTDVHIFIARGWNEDCKYSNHSIDYDGFAS